MVRNSSFIMTFKCLTTTVLITPSIASQIDEAVQYRNDDKNSNGSNVQKKSNFKARFNAATSVMTRTVSSSKFLVVGPATMNNRFADLYTCSKNYKFSAS
jgi:hypothetical protein